MHELLPTPVVKLNASVSRSVTLENVELPIILISPLHTALYIVGTGIGMVMGSVTVPGTGTGMGMGIA